MPNYPYTFQLPPLNVQDIPNDGVPGEFLGISAGGVLDWLPVATGGGDMLKSENLSGLASYPTARTNLGLGTGDSPTFANLTLTSPSLSSSAPVTISQTWNNAAVAFTGLRFNAVSTNSAAGSLLLDLQLNGSKRFTVQKNGSVLFRTDSSIDFGNEAETSTTAAVYPSTAVQEVRLSNGAKLGWTPTSVYNVLDTILLRDGAANTLALRNGANAQTFNVYGTWTTAITNFERLAIKYNATDVAYQIAAEKGSTNGDYRPLQLWTGGASRLHVSTAGNVGIGTTSPTSKLHVAETWNAAGTTFAAAKIVVTDTASAADSNLLELWSGSTPTMKVSVKKGGTIISKVGVIQTSGYSNTAGVSLELVYANCGLGFDVNANTAFIINSIAKTRCGAGIVTSSDQPIGWTNDTHVGTSATLDTILVRDGEPYHLATRNGTNGQKFSVYGTYPGAAWERFTITAPTSGNVLLGTYKGTGGIARGLEFQTDGVTRLTIGTGGDVNLSNALVFGGSGQFRFLSSGVAFLTNAAQTDFGRLCLGGNTASFPAIKRSSTTLQARLADDSAFAPIQGKLTTDTAFDATVVTPTGFITLYDSTGTAYKVPCVPA